MKNFLKIFRAILIVSLLSFASAFASSEHGETGHGLSPKVIHTMGFQLVNVVILFVGIYFLTRKTLSAHFKKRREDYLSQSQKAEQAKRQAQAELNELENKIKILDQTEAASLLRATAEASDLKTQIVSDALGLSKKLKEEALSAVALEADRARGQLRDQLISKAVGAARSHFEAQVSHEDHQKLQVDFISNIGALHR